MDEFLTIPQAIELTDKSASTLLRFIRKYRKDNPNQKDVLLVQKGLTREYRLNRSLIEKHFKTVQKHTTVNVNKSKTDEATGQTRERGVSTGQIEVLYKALLEEREKRILELKRFNDRISQENTELRSFNRQFSGYFANLSKTLQLTDGKEHSKKQAGKTSTAAVNKKAGQSVVKGKVVKKKAKTERISKNKRTTTNKKKQVKKKTFWQKLFS